MTSSFTLTSMVRKIGRLTQFIIKEIVEPDNDSDYSTDDERENVTDEDS